MSSPMTPDMVYELSGVADPVLCPDGRRMAYASSWVERTENGDARTISRLMLMDLETGQTREFTQGIADTGPRFSPDGKSLAFLRSPGEGPRQVWVMDASGGEARPVTSQPEGSGGLRVVAGRRAHGLLRRCGAVRLAPASPAAGPRSRW